MSSSGVDQRQENTGDTGRMPALSSSSPPSPTQQAPAAERRIAVLGPTLRFKGDLSAEEDFILQGRIQGSIYHSQKIIVGTQGAVTGNIHARVVVVDGNVQGDLHGIESVVVHETGRVVGNIFAPRVGLSDGAVFNGRIDMTGTANATQVSSPSANQAATAVATPVAAPVAAPSNSSNPTIKRVETPTMSPGRPMSAEETEKILAPKVAVLPPPARREKAG